MARAPVTDEVEVLDEEFLHHLRRGADLLASGDAAAAATALERARELRPSDAQVLGLLGQSVYKLGRFDDAIEIYQQLVDGSPTEAAARVNLGLANLKAKRYLQAIRQFEIAIDLNPDHQRAMGYLGLAWLENGDPGRARTWFERSGSAQMVARCDELLAEAAELAERAAAEQETSLPPGAILLDRAVEEKDRPAGLRTIAELTLRRGERFSTDRGLLTISVDDDVLVRTEGLVAAHGAVRLTSEPRRSRGASEGAFTDGTRRMVRAAGRGALVFEPGEKRLFRLQLEDEPGYFRDEAVFAVEGRLPVESGRLASRSGAAIEVVHLRGRGQVLLASTAEIVAVAVGPEAPLRVRAAALVGWIGTLTPHFVTLPGDREREAGGDASAIELTGSGRVLLEGAAA